MKQITIHCNGKEADLHLDTSASVKSLRQQLIDGNFLPKDKQANYWFFLNKSDPENNPAELGGWLIPPYLEDQLTLEKVLISDNTVILTNVKAQKNKDLVGFKTTWWRDRDIHVKCYRPGDSKMEYEPLLLKNVVQIGADSEGSTSANVLNNVCICEPNKKIGFSIYSNKGIGYKFSISVDSDDKQTDIVGGLLCTYDYGENGCVGIERWQDSDNAIIITPTRELHIDAGKAYYYQRVTVKCVPVSQYKKEEWGKVYHDDGRKTLLAPRAAGSEIPTVPVPGEWIEPGTPQKGDQTGGGFGTIYDVKCRDNEVMGEVTITFFTFRSLEDAKKVFKYTDPIEAVYD